MTLRPPQNPLDTTMPTGSFWDNVHAPAQKRHTAAEARATQAFLRNKGYAVKVDGIWGSETESAARNWRTARNPNIWNRSSNAKPRTLPQPQRTSPNAPMANGGIAPKPQRTPAGSSGSASNPIQFTAFPDTSAGNPLPMSMGNQVGNPMNPALAGVGQPFNPAMAAQYAGMEFNPQIQALGNQIKFLPHQTAQDLHDISTWYGQVKGDVSKAQAAAAAQGAANTASIGNATSGILNSLGGADGGGAMIAGAGIDNANLAGQLGSIESNYLAQQNPILAADAAAQLTRENARMQGVGRDLTNQQLDLRGQRGAKQGELAMQMREYNNQLAGQKNTNLLNIGQYNNSLTQQRGTNALSIAQYNNQLAQQERQNAMDNINTQAGLDLTHAQTGLIQKQAAATTKTGAFVPWDRLNPQQQNTMLQQGLAQVAPVQGALHGWKYVNPTDTSPAAQVIRNANQRIINGAQMSMRKFFMAHHYKNPRLDTLIKQQVNGAVKRASALAQGNQKY